MKEERKDRTCQHAQTNHDLDLLHEWKHFFLRPSDRVTGSFPGLDAALKVGNIGVAEGLEFFLGLSTSFSAAAGYDEWLVAGYLMGPLLQLAQWNQPGTGDVFLRMLDRLAHVHEMTLPLIEKRF